MPLTRAAFFQNLLSRIDTEGEPESDDAGFFVFGALLPFDGVGMTVSCFHKWS